MALVNMEQMTRLEGWKLASGSRAPAHRIIQVFGKRIGRSEARIQTLKGWGRWLSSFHIITIKRAKALINPSKEWNVHPGGGVIPRARPAVR